MFIEFEETPNPNTLKFLPGQLVVPSGTREYRTAEEAAAGSPLAARLFTVDGVCGVFLGHNFVSVSRMDDADWDGLKPLIMTLLMEHFSAGLPVITDEDSKPSVSAEDEDNSEIAQQIREILDTRVKPAVAMDGGNIEYVRFEDGVVFLRMEGACAGCPSSTMTLKHGIEGLLKHFIPEVERVEAEQGDYHYG